MPHKCKKCLRELRPWSKFKDLKSKEGLGLAICGSIINGVDHFWSGESRSNKQKADFRTLDLHYCEHCSLTTLCVRNVVPSILFQKCPMKHAL